MRILDGALGNSLGEQVFEGLVMLALLGSAIGIVFATRWGFDSHPQATSTILFVSLLALAYGAGILVRSTRRKKWTIVPTLAAVVLITFPSLGWLSLIAPKFINFVLDI